MKMNPSNVKTLSESAQKELQIFLERDDINAILSCAVLALFLFKEKISLEEVKKESYRLIENLLSSKSTRKTFPRLSPELYQNLKTILNQNFDRLKNMDTNLVIKNNINFFLRENRRQIEYEYFDFERELKDFVKKYFSNSKFLNKKIIPLVDKDLGFKVEGLPIIDKAKELKEKNSIIVRVFLFLSINWIIKTTLIQGLKEKAQKNGWLSFEGIIFIALKIFIFLLIATFFKDFISYKRSSNQFDEILNDPKLEMGNLSNFLNLSEIYILDSQTGEKIGSCFLPTLRDDFSSQAQEQSENDSSFSSEEPSVVSYRTPKALKSRPAAQAPSPRYKFAKPSRVLPQKVSWDPSVVLGGNQGNPLVKDQNFFEMYATFFSASSRFFAFFNEAVLENQLVRGEKKWGNYQAAIQSGRVVPSHGASGIKKLNPAYLTTVNWQDQKKEFVFDWAVKDINEAYRLLGMHVSDIKLDSQGNRYILVDFCCHMERGPGKNPQRDKR